MTSNNTIEGTEWKTLPDVGDAPLVNDTSSDMFSRPIDVSRHALIYAGAQKNMGPSGVTVVIIREDLLPRSVEKKATLPTMMNYAVHAENGSLYNTPPVFGVYALGLVMKWLRGQGGLEAIAKVNERKAATLYAEIDRTGFYRGTADKACRSLMNVTFRLATEDLEKQFVKDATAAGSRRSEGAPLGRRHPGVHLQRLPGGGCGRPGRLHEGVRADAGLDGRQTGGLSGRPIARKAILCYTCSFRRSPPIRRWSPRSPRVFGG